MQDQNQPNQPTSTGLLKNYILVGTSLYFLLYKLEGQIARWGNGSKFPLLDTYQAEKWQSRSVAVTLLFPILFPIIGLFDLVVLCYAGVAAVVKRVRQPASNTWGRVSTTVNQSEAGVRSVWEETTKGAENKSPIDLPDVQQMKKSLGETGDKVRGAVETTGKRVSTAASSARERAGETLESAGKRVNEVGEKARHQAEETLDAAGKRVSDAADRVRKQTGEMRQTTGNSIGEGAEKITEQSVDSGDHSGPLDSRPQNPNDLPPVGANPNTKTVELAGPPYAAPPDDEPTSPYKTAAPEIQPVPDEDVTSPFPPPETTAPAKANGQTVHINSATAAELETLPGIGKALAQRIVEYRQVHGRFDDLHALSRVGGLHAKVLDKLSGRIDFD
jgi:competence ComEA-like helix-hairpin-helix protein